MFKNFKKILSLVLSLTIFATFLSACGNSSNNEEKHSKTGAKDIVKLKYFSIGEEPKDKQMVLDTLNKYLGEKIGVNLDMSYINFGDYNQKMSIIINSGEDFDLAFTCSWAGDYLGNSRKGAFLDLTPYLDNIAKDMYQAIDPKFWEGAKIDGKIYAVPNQKELAVMPMWVFTKEYVDKYKIPYKDIHSLEDLEPWLKIIKEKEPDVVPLYITKGFSLPQDFDFITNPVGIELDDKNLEVKSIFDTTKMEDSLKTLRKYYKLGYINADSATAQNNKSIKRFVTKADGQPFADFIWGKDLGYEVVSSDIMDSLVTNDSTTGSMIAVSSNSKHKEESVKFLNLLNTDPYVRNLLNYGIEGTHYTKVKDNVIKLDPEKSKNYSIPYFTMGNLFITYTLDTEPENKWEVFKEFNKNSKNSPILGFKFDTTPVMNELAAINNVREEFKPIIFSGSVEPEEYLKKLREKLKAQNIDKVIQEAKTQLEEWEKTKNK